MPTSGRGRTSGLFGVFVMATGLLHTAVGLYVYRSELAEIGRAGLFGSVRGDRTPGAAAIWFFTAGFLLLVLGGLIRWAEVELDRPLPAQLGVALIAVALVTGAVMPENGVWLLIPQGVLIILRARRTRPHAVARV